jgi:hypothetical protein
MQRRPSSSESCAEVFFEIYAEKALTITHRGDIGLMPHERYRFSADSAYP